MIIRNVLREKQFFLYIFLIGLNLFLVTLPLTNSLGFEFAFVNSICFFIIGGFSTARFFKTNQHEIFLYYKTRWKRILSLLLIPFIIGFVASVFSSRCPIQDGVGFYLTITIPSVFFGNLTGFISAILSKRRSLMIFFIIFILILLITLFEFYFNPQVYFYNPIFGFFPGTIYDEDVAVNLRLILFQCYNFIFFIGILFFLKYWKKKYSSNLGLYFYLWLLLLLSIFLKPFFGFSTDNWRMNRELSRQVITQHFIIHFGDKIDQSELEFISLLHEYYYDILTSKLDVKMNDRITSYIYDDHEQKRYLFGSGNANVAKPWLHQIYLNYENYELALKHEISHIIAAEFGYSIFKIADGFNPAMIEGFAMFAEDDFAGYPVRYAAKLAYATNHRINFTKLFSGINFFTSYSSLAYIYSGAFIDFLNEEYGINKVKDIYRDSNWEKVYGEDILTLLTRFEKTLSDDSTYFNPNKAQLFFGGQTIFKKFCPRMASNELKEAEELMVKKEYPEAEKLYRKIFRYSNSYSSLAGITTSLNRQDKYSGSIAILKKEINNYAKSQSLYNLELQLADSYALSKDTTNAMLKYDSLLTQSPHINYDNEVRTRKMIIRRWGTDTLKSFLRAKREKRIEKLIALNQDGIKYFTLPNLLRLAADKKYDLTGWFENFKSNFIISDYESSNAAISVSRYFLEKNDYLNAKYYAVKALDFKTNVNDSFAAVENLKLANWFFNFASETKTSFHYSR